MEELIQVEEILTEANAYGLRQEVILTALNFIEDGYSMLEAYQLSFMDWVK